MSNKKQPDLFDEEKRDKDISSIDRLFRDVKRYRKCSEFKKKLEFYASFPYLGVYNAALVEQQRPGARFVLTSKKWVEKFNRKIKPNARPVIILMPFYPVEFLFDITDTKQIDNKRKVDENIIIEQIIHQFKASSAHDTGFYMKNLRDNLPKLGILFNQKYIVGSEIEAEIRSDQSETMPIKIGYGHMVNHHNYFTISVDSMANEAEQLAAVFHELAHLFCQHIKCSWWEGRSFTSETKEFEAETVAYLVCKRLGIQSHSVEYLANYLDENEQIPPILLDFVFQAVDLVERATTGNIEITKSLLYKKDPTFKEKVDKERERIKEEQEEARKTRPSF